MSMRVHYMDALRSALMALGVFYHAAALYMPDRLWRVPTADGHIVFTWFAGVVHAFRMPAFFVVAGYFCLLTLQKYGEDRFLRLRLQRLAIPLAATAVFVNTWMNYLSWGNYRQLGFIEYVTSPAYIAEGVWIGQLWFLNNLIAYSLLAFCAVKLLRLPFLADSPRLLDGLLSRWIRLPWHAALLAALLPLTHMALLRLAWRLDGPGSAYLGHLIDLDLLARYLPYFLTGILLYRQQRLLDMVAGSRFWLTGLGLAATAAALSRVGGSSYLLEYAGFAVAWGLAGTCLAVFRRLFDRSSPMFRYFSTASYTIYLLHQLSVVALGVALEATEAPVFVKFGLVVTLTFLLTGSIHHFLVLRLPLLRLLLNGTAGGAARRPVWADTRRPA